jgi:hypothetical protein
MRRNRQPATVRRQRTDVGGASRREQIFLVGDWILAGLRRVTATRLEARSSVVAALWPARGLASAKEQRASVSDAPSADARSGPQKRVQGQLQRERLRVVLSEHVVRLDRDASFPCESSGATVGTCTQLAVRLVEEENRRARGLAGARVCCSSSYWSPAAGSAPR